MINPPNCPIVGSNNKKISNMSLKDYLKMCDKIDFNPYYQRGEVWNYPMKQMYLKSFITKNTADTFIIKVKSEKDEVEDEDDEDDEDDEEEDKKEYDYVNCDGKQRTKVLLDFFNNKIGFEYKNKIFYFSEKPNEEVYYKTFKKEMRNRLLDRKICVFEFDEDVDGEELFKSINISVKNDLIDKKDKLTKEFQQKNKRFIKQVSKKFKEKLGDGDYELTIMKLFYNTQLDDEKDENLFIKSKVLLNTQEWFFDGTLKVRQLEFKKNLDFALEKIATLKNKYSDLTTKFDVFSLVIMIHLLKEKKDIDVNKLYMKLEKNKITSKHSSSFWTIIDKVQEYFNNN